MKFFSSTFQILVLASSLVVSAMGQEAAIDLTSTSTELRVYPKTAEVIEAIVDGEVVAGTGRRLDSGRKLQSSQLGLFDDCDDGFSKFGFTITQFTGTMGDLDFVAIDTCLDKIVFEGQIGTMNQVYQACVPDGHEIVITVFGTGTFNIAVDHIDSSTGHNTGVGAGSALFDATGGGSILGGLVLGGFFVDSGLAFSQALATTIVNPNLVNAAVQVTTRIGEEDCKSETQPDPHFKTFSGDWFDFHGGCDIVLIDVPDYANQAGLAINIRTTVRYAYSFIESLAIKVGEDILQVSGWGDYILNGISNAELEGATLNGLPVTREVISEKQYKFIVNLENGHHFTIKVFKDMISTTFDLHEEHDVRGILGDKHGARIARDGVTIIEDAIEFGQEWQVQDTDHQLFQTVREPQFPAKCIMPDPVEREKRRLSATVSQEAAEAACSHIKDEHVRDMCIFDVISVDDLSLAAGAY